MKDKALQFGIWLYVALIIASLGVIAIFFPWSGLNGLTIFSRWYLETENYSTLGNFVYGISVPFLSFATVILLWRTYTLQNLQLEEQRDSIRKQRFQEMFFDLLNVHNNLVDDIDLREIKDSTKIVAVKRDVFKVLMKAVLEHCKKEKIESLEETLKVYNRMQDHNKGDLHHYYRFTYRVLRFIKDTEDIDESDKYNLAGIFRAVFSPYELALIFYNGLHEFGEDKLKPLLEEYSFFKNIDFTLLTSEEHRKEYHEVAYADRNKKTREQNLAEWKLEQQKMEAMKEVQPVE